MAVWRVYHIARGILNHIRTVSNLLNKAKLIQRFVRSQIQASPFHLIVVELFLDSVSFPSLIPFLQLMLHHKVFLRMTSYLQKGPRFHVGLDFLPVSTVLGESFLEFQLLLCGPSPLSRRNPF